MSLPDDDQLPPEPPRQTELQESAKPPLQNQQTHTDATQFVAQPEEPPQERPLAGDPIDLAAGATPVWPSRPQTKQVPEDLRVPWSWLHLIVFALFGVFSLAAVQIGLLLHYVSPRSLSNQRELERIVLAKPQLAVGTMVIWYALVLLFLYVTLAVFHNVPFWRSLGWRRIGWREGRWPKSPWLYLGAGCALSVLVFIVTAKMQPPENIPIEELFHYKNTALLFMAMAVLVAPLVEETVFRGYLYPLFAKSFGVVASILITGTLFGLMHGAQLGWTWELVSVLICVGVVFTFVRARTGSVFASFLLHLGYNTTIAVFTILGTEGFSKIPTH
jgi:membrane protease YdiL (CAAX protease family)